MTISYQIRNTLDQEIGAVEFGASIASSQTGTQTVRIYNDGDATPDTLTFGCMTEDLHYTGDTTANGQEVVTEQWLEAKVGAGVWTPIGGDPTTPANVLDLTPPTPGTYLDVLLRLNTPAAPSTTAIFLFVPILTFPVET